MKIAVRELHGNWEEGIALDKHSVRSVPTGINAYGHTTFDTTRTEIGESLFQLKYRDDWTQVAPLAEVLATIAKSRFPSIEMVIPMAASNVRTRQPVAEVAIEAAALLGKPCIDLLRKRHNGKSLKNLSTKAEKDDALKDSISLNAIIQNEGRWDALLVDDLYHTGASLEAACNVLQTYEKIGRIYVAVLTWR